MIIIILIHHLNIPIKNILINWSQNIYEIIWNHSDFKLFKINKLLCKNHLFWSQYFLNKVDVIKKLV